VVLWGLFLSCSIGPAVDVSIRRNYLAKRNTLIKVVDVSTGGGLQKQQSTSQGGGGMGQGSVNIFAIFGHVIDVL